VRDSRRQSDITRVEVGVAAALVTMVVCAANVFLLVVKQRRGKAD
jgi:hypothetical protein